MKVRNIYGTDHKIPTGSIVKRKDMSPPTMSDIRYTKELFLGFDIHEDIPEFNTKNDLYNWRNQVIKNNVGLYC